MKFEKQTFWTVAAIVGLALVLRCFALGQQSLWWDEFASWVCSQHGFWGAMSCDAFQKPPLYYSLLHYWMLLFGSSESALRALSVPPSVVSVWLMYLLGSKLFGRGPGYLSALYQAVSTFQIYFAQEARNYSWLVLFLLLAGLFLWNALNDALPKHRRLYWIAYTASITLALYTHYFAAFFIAGHGLYVLFRRRDQLLAATISIGTSFVLIAPFLWLFLHHPEASADQLRHFPLLKLPQAYFAFLFGDSLIPMDNLAVHSLVPTLAAHAWLIALVLMSAAVLCYFCWLAWRRWREPLSYVAWQAGVPVALAFVISLQKTFFDRRYMIPASGYVYLLIAAAVWEIFLTARGQDASRWKAIAGGAAIATWCALLALSLYQYYFTSRFGKEQWREAVAYLDAAAADSRDLLLVDPGKMQLCFQYYAKRNLHVLPVTPELEDAMADSEQPVRDHARGFHRIWLIYSHTFNQRVLLRLREMYGKGSCREFPQANGIQIYLFQVANSG